MKRSAASYAASTTIPDSTTLYFGPWYGRSPFFEATLRAGCSAYDVCHTYIPACYDDPVTEYWHLLEKVTLWDVGVEHIVQIKGPDAGPDRARRARQRACVRGPVRRFQGFRRCNS